LAAIAANSKGSGFGEIGHFHRLGTYPRMTWWEVVNFHWFHLEPSRERCVKLRRGAQLRDVANKFTMGVDEQKVFPVKMSLRKLI